jgi:hypothetical protein
MVIAPSRAVASARRRHAAPPQPGDGQLFLGLIDPVLVRSPAAFLFSGAVPVKEADAIWTWMVRDLAPDLLDIAVEGDEALGRVALEHLVPELLVRARVALTEAAGDLEKSRRLRSQLGGDEAFERLSVVLAALRCRELLHKAQGFGRAANGIQDDVALVTALQAMPFNDPPVAALLMQAAVGQVTVPARLITAAIRIAGGASDTALMRAGLAPLVDALLAHAQSQLPALTQPDSFGDMDLVCLSVDRFHRLIRAVTGYVELGPKSRWATIVARLIKGISERLEPKLREVVPDLNQALRRREGADRLDSDGILSALNGIYLLQSVRESRDSLALSELFDQVWGQSGQTLEIHVERLLQQLRQNPADPIVSARLDAALTMAAVRFGQDYADTLRRAKESAERRTG